MSRIRTIKPEIIDDDVTAHLSDGAWRLFVSLMVMADDYGNLRANPRQIRGQAFWAREDAPVSDWLRELGETELLEFYSVHGQQYAHIRGWSKHQRVDKPGKPHVPGPEQAESTGYVDSSRDPRNSQRGLAPDLRPPTTTTTSTSDHDDDQRAITALVVPAESKPISNTADLEQAASEWGWQVQLSQNDVLRLRELLDDRPIDATEVAFARAQADQRPRGRRVAYFLGTVKGQREDARNGVKPRARGDPQGQRPYISKKDQEILSALEGAGLSPMQPGRVVDAKLR